MINRAERYEKNTDKLGEKLHDLLSIVAKETNISVSRENPDIQKFLNSDGSINMDSFDTEYDGIYEHDNVQKDKDFVRNKDIEWSGASNQSVQDFFQSKYHTNSIDEIIEQTKKNKLEHHGPQLEMALTILLHKIIGNRFIVARASTFDDYRNGIDNVIINKETGDVVCAFDEVNDTVGGSRHDKKMEKIKKKALQGGSTIKYGYTYINDEEASKKRLIQKKINNVPTFFLSLSQEELKNLLSNMSYDAQIISNKEYEIYDKLIHSLEEQVVFLSNERLPSAIKDNLILFSTSLNSMKDIASHKKTA